MQKLKAGSFELATIKIGRNRSILPMEKQKEVDLFKKDLARFLTQKLETPKNMDNSLHIPKQLNQNQLNR